MPKLNAMNIVTHAGADAEVNQTNNGNTVVKISVPIESGWGDRKQTAWSMVQIWGKATEWMQNVQKGDLVLIHNAEYCVDEYEKAGS